MPLDPPQITQVLGSMLLVDGFHELCTSFDFSCAIQILLNGTSVIENATITGFSVVPAAPPIAPSPPFIPPEFENATINGEPVLTPVEEVTTPRPPPTTGEGESVRYTIPAAMRVTMEPQEEVAIVCTTVHLTGEGDCM